PAEPASGLRLYLCAFRGEPRGWVVLDEEGRAVRDRALVGEAVSIAAMCELAEENAAGGDVASLRARLRELRETEQPEGIEEAEQAAEALEQVIGAPPRVASAEYLGAVGAATLRLERVLAPDEALSP